MVSLAEEMRQLAAREGIDAATERLYRRVVESPVHGPFIQRIDEIRRREEPAAWRSEAILAIVPAAFYRENPASGADGHVVRGVAERLGCPVVVVPVASTGTVRENARTLIDFLRAQPPERPVILASLSKGAADVKMALADPAARRAFDAVAAWINLCGILNGTPMADWLLSPAVGAVLGRLYYRLHRQDLGFLRDLRHGPGQALDHELVLPEHLEMISVAGFPLVEHLTSGAAKRCHHRLTPLGPNDGSVLLADACSQPGLLYPLWGADHYLRPKEDVRPLLAAILHYVEEAALCRIRG